MTTLCHYPGDRDDIIVSYLYDAIDPAERASFDAHLATCGVCRTELAELREVRRRLGEWTPPERAPLFGGQPGAQTKRRAGPWAALADIPAWAQVAAALLILGVAAGIANVRVQYGHDGLIVQTGWSRTAAPLPSTAAAPWRGDLAALARQLRTEFHDADIAMQTSGSRQNEPISVADAGVIRRVRTLIDESERRQRREIALQVAAGVAGVVRDVQTQRQADLVRIDQSLGYIQNHTGIEVAKQRELLNYLVHVSQKQ
jgi:hypothetical protein